MDHFIDMNHTKLDSYHERGSTDGSAYGAVSPLFVQRVLSSLMYAAAGALFYKKSFNKSMLPTLWSLLWLGLVSERFAQSNVVFMSAYLIVVVTRLLAVSGDVLASRSFRLSAAVFFVALLDARIDWLRGAVPYWIRISATALAQFVRRPLWLKARLQGLRSKLGPLYLLYVTRTAIDGCGGGSSVPLRCLAALATLTACAAGCFFRPDNKCVIDYFCPGTTLAWRRYYHGRLMLVSLAAIASFVCLQHST